MKLATFQTFEIMEPDFPMALSKLQLMSKDELQELFTNESKFDDFIKSLDQVISSDNNVAFFSSFFNG